VVWIGVLVAGLTLWFGSDYFGPIINMGRVAIPGGLLISLTGLLLIEQLYRNSPPESRWGIKALALGLGGLFTYDLFLFSQGVLFNALDAATWLARGAVNILFIPLIAIAARRNPDWDLKIFVSRHVVFYSTSLVAVGFYLLLMSLVLFNVISRRWFLPFADEPRWLRPSGLWWQLGRAGKSCVFRRRRFGVDHFAVFQFPAVTVQGFSEQAFLP
jgi:hypothetical protein